MLLAALPLLHRKSKHPELVQPQPQISGRRRGPGGAEGLEATPVAGVDGSRVPQDLQVGYGEWTSFCLKDRRKLEKIMVLEVMSKNQHNLYSAEGTREKPM